VTIDGSPSTLQAANVGFQGVIVPSGAHTISFRYSNPLIPISAAISIVSLILAIAICFRKSS
jgi:uncharacterized membrane protein YfhO